LCRNEYWVGVRKRLIDWRAPEKVPGDMVIKFPTKAARRYKFSTRGNGFREAQMMPAIVHS
jgi:hypothetical protein